MPPVVVPVVMTMVTPVPIAPGVMWPVAIIVMAYSVDYGGMKISPPVVVARHPLRACGADRPEQEHEAQEKPN